MDRALALFDLKDAITEAHPGTKVFLIPLFQRMKSAWPMWTQVMGFGNTIKNVSDSYRETGINIIGYSQGGLISRGVIQVCWWTSTHSVRHYLFHTLYHIYDMPTEACLTFIDSGWFEHSYVYLTERTSRRTVWRHQLPVCSFSIIYDIVLNIKGNFWMSKKCWQLCINFHFLQEIFISSLFERYSLPNTLFEIRTNV